MGRAFNTSQAISEIACNAHPLSFITTAEYDPLLAAIGNARLVLIGEASHGTHDFYRERARITRRLIEEIGFAAVAVERDWPHAERVSHYVEAHPFEQFDAVIHIDRTLALIPLEASVPWHEDEEVPETFPSTV